MVVTGIEELTKSRSRVFIDGEFAFVLYKGELRLFKMKENQELSKEIYDRIMEEVLPKRAKMRAMNLLLKKNLTTAQLKEKLRRGGYPEAIADEALSYVASFHYTDDLRLAVDYIMCHCNTKTRARMEQDLRGKGIPEELFEKAWEQWERDGGEQNEQEMIRRLLQKRGYDPEGASQAQRQKEYAFLMRKGFASENIRRAVFGRNDTWMD